MRQNNLEPFLVINWGFENYRYIHRFNLNRVGYCHSETFLNGKKLEKPKWLYKYYSNKDYNLDALENSYLYFTSPRDLNDPFDCMNNREHIIMRGGKEIKKHRDNIGVCCFSLSNNNPLMWGHYTNNYKGFCVKYKNESVLEDIEIPIRSHASYLNKYEPSNRNLSKAIEELEGYNLPKDTENRIHIILKMLFEYCNKFIDWKYEKEYRAISISANNFNRKFKIPKSEIEEIYIGHKMKELKPKFYNRLIQLVDKNYKDIKVFEVKPHPLVVKLDFQEIKIDTLEKR